MTVTRNRWDIESPFSEDSDADLKMAVVIFCDNELEISEYIRDGKFSMLESLINLAKMKLKYGDGHQIAHESWKHTIYGLGLDKEDFYTEDDEE